MFKETAKKFKELSRDLPKTDYVWRDALAASWLRNSFKTRHIAPNCLLAQIHDLAGRRCW